MKVQDIMSKPAVSCSPDTDLAAAAMMMWDHDCGVIPVVSAAGKTIGVITDRDICMAVATKHRKAEEIAVGEVCNGPLRACKPTDDIKTALGLIKTGRIHRLPVIDAQSRLQGMLSMNDVVLAASASKSGSPSYEDVITAFKAICTHQGRTAVAGTAVAA